MDIKIVGLRPGEKLYEGLMMDEEQDKMRRTVHNKIFVAPPRNIDLGEFYQQLKELAVAAEHNDDSVVEQFVKWYLPLPPPARTSSCKTTLAAQHPCCVKNIRGCTICGKAVLTESMAQDIIQDVPTPFHVYDEKGIRENARRINKAFSWNKGFREYFAVKALPNPVILQILKEEGCGVDCSSLTELMLSEVCGFSGSDIMFSSNQTPVEDMKKAYELGAYINLDDATMVDFLDRVAGVPENIFCRYNPGGTFQLGESKEGFQVMDKPGDAKYGMTEEQMIDSYKKLAAKGAKNFGIHAFLASNTISDAYYPELAGILFQLAVRVQKASGVHIAYINLSGGVGIPYRPRRRREQHHGRSEASTEFEEILVPAGMGDVSIFTEMGRFTWPLRRSVILPSGSIYRIHRSGCLHGNLVPPPSCGAYRTSPCFGQGKTHPDHKNCQCGRRSVTRTTFQSLPSTVCCPKSTSATSCISTIPVRTALPWATTTTASCAAPRSCSARTALTASAAVPRLPATTLQRWTSCPS